MTHLVEKPRLFPSKILITLLLITKSIMASSPTHAFNVYLGLETKKINISEVFTEKRSENIFNLFFSPSESLKSNSNNTILRTYIGYNFINTTFSRTGIEAGHDYLGPTYIKTEDSSIFISSGTWYDYKLADLMLAHHRYLLKDKKILTAFGKFGFLRERIYTSSRLAKNNLIVTDVVSGIIPQVSLGLQFRPWKLISVDFYADKKLRKLHKKTSLSSLLTNNNLTFGGGITLHF